MTPEEAVELVLNVLGDRPSGPDPREVLATIQAQAWEEGRQAEEDAPPLHRADHNPYRSQE